MVIKLQGCRLTYFMKYKNILVTGGYGYLASHVVDQLSKKNYKVTIIDKKKKKNFPQRHKIIIGDIKNLKFLNKCFKHQDVIFHFAGDADLYASNKNHLKTIKNNILGTSNVLEASVKNKIKKFVLASSIYAMSSQGGFYSMSKLASEMLTEKYAEKFKFKFVILRFGSIYGGRANNFNTINNFINEAKKNKKIIRKSKGDEVRNYIHVKDVAKLCKIILNKKYDNGFYNIFGKEKSTVLDVLKIIKKELPKTKLILKKKNRLIYNYKSNPFTYKINSGKVVKLKKYINLSSGIKDIIDKK